MKSFIVNFFKYDESESIKNRTVEQKFEKQRNNINDLKQDFEIKVGFESKFNAS